MIHSIRFTWIDTDKPGTWKGEGASPMSGRMIAVLQVKAFGEWQPEVRLLVDKKMYEHRSIRIEAFNILMERVRRELGV